MSSTFYAVNSGIGEIASVINRHRPVLQQLNIKGPTLSEAKGMYIW